MAALAVSPLVLSPLPPVASEDDDGNDDDVNRRGSSSASSSLRASSPSPSPPPSTAASPAPSMAANGNGKGWPPLLLPFGASPAASILSPASSAPPSSRIPAFRGLAGGGSGASSASASPVGSGGGGGSCCWHTGPAVITVDSLTRPSITPPIPLNQLLKGQASGQVTEMLQGLLKAAEAQAAAAAGRL